MKSIPPVLISPSNDVPLLLSLHCLGGSAEEGSNFASSVGYCKVTSMHTNKSYTCAKILMFICYKKEIQKQSSGAEGGIT